MTHKFEISYRGVEVPEGLTNNLDRPEASWFKRGVDAAIEARQVAKEYVLGFAYGGWLPRSYWENAVKPESEYRYFLSSLTGTYWRVRGDAVESYAPVRNRWVRSTTRRDALEQLERISEVGASEVPEKVRNAPDPK